MESVGIVHTLWRRRAWAALGVLLAIAVAVLSLYQVSTSAPFLVSKTTSSGFAWQRLLVDTHSSVLADAKAKGAEAIASKAVLLGDLTEGAGARREMAAAVGARPAEIGVLGPGSQVPARVTALATQALEVTRPRTPYLVALSEAPDLPILSLYATGPDEAGAARLIRGTTRAMAVLARQAPGVEGDARIEPVGKAQSGTKLVGARKAKALVLAALVLLLCWTAVVLADGIDRRRRLA